MSKELLIFGANGALGRGVTESLIKKDYSKIYLLDFNLDGLPEGANIKKNLVKDLSIEANVSEAFKKIMPSEEKIFFIYSTVGGFAGGNSIWETGTDELDKMINMNLKSSFLIGKYFAKLVKESKAGSICFTAAFTGVNAEPKKAAYGAAKAALIHLVKTMALEGKEINLSVNAIAPYIIDTPSNREWMQNADYSKWMKPTEIGELIHSLFNNFYFITGNVLSLTNRFSITL
jgi:NAD(P)-dependent dehydrogenase (short-subunit alcohol dehydrogenase family)